MSLEFYFINKAVGFVVRVDNLIVSAGNFSSKWKSKCSCLPIRQEKLLTSITISMGCPPGPRLDLLYKCASFWPCHKYVVLVLFRKFSTYSHKDHVLRELSQQLWIIAYLQDLCTQFCVIGLGSAAEAGPLCQRPFHVSRGKVTLC